MPVHAVAHLNFHGRARDALEFYGSVFGGQVVVATYGDLGMPADLPGADAVVWGQVVADNGFRVMAYDVPGLAAPAAPGAPTTRRENGTTITSEPFFVSVRGDNVEEVGALWEGLSAGASVVEPFGPAQWAPAFGMLTDRFGVTWIPTSPPLAPPDPRTDTVLRARGGRPPARMAPWTTRSGPTGRARCSASWPGSCTGPARRRPRRCAGTG